MNPTRNEWKASINPSCIGERLKKNARDAYGLEIGRAPIKQWTVSDEPGMQ
jgi:hypothetical protein